MEKKKEIAGNNVTILGKSMFQVGGGGGCCFITLRLMKKVKNNPMQCVPRCSTQVLLECPVRFNKHGCTNLENLKLGKTVSVIRSPARVRSHI